MAVNIRALIVDDELSNIENLQTLLQKHCSNIEVVATAGTVEDAARLAAYHRPDLFFLDIQLKDGSGFDLLKLISGNSFEIIFVTAFDHYGIQAIKFAALDYLLKPIDIDELVAAVLKAANKISGRQPNDQLDFLLNHLKKGSQCPVKIALPQQKEVKYVPVNTIIRCEADSSYTFFYLTGGEKILVSKVLKEYADLLKDRGFIRTHQSHLVNVEFVKSWLKEDGGALLLDNGDKVPVAKPNREKVRSALSGISVAAY